MDPDRSVRSGRARPSAAQPGSITPPNLCLGAHSSLTNRWSADASQPAKMGTAEKGAGRDCKQPPAVPKYKG